MNINEALDEHVGKLNKMISSLENLATEEVAGVELSQ